MVAIDYDLYVITLALCTGLLFILSIYSYKSKGNLTKLFTFISLSGLFYCIAELIATFITYTPLTTFLHSTLSLSLSCFISFWLMFIGKYCDIKKLRTEKSRRILLIFPIIMLISVIINLYYPIIIAPTDKYLIFIKKPMAYLTYVYFVLITIIGEYLLLIELQNTDRKSRKSIFVLIAVPLIIIIPSGLLIIFRTNTMNFITLFTTISTLLLFYNLYVTNTFYSKPFLKEIFLKNIDVAMAFFDKEEHLVEFNNAFSEFTGLSYDFIDKSAQEIFEIFNTSQKFIDIYEKEENTTFFYEKKNVWIDLTCNKLYENKQYIGKLYTYYDISKVKYEENKVFLAEKEAIAKTKKLNQANKDIKILVKEVHHRVKNNLQLIVSSIHLDRKFKTDPELILESTVNRLSALTLMYDNSYVKKSYSYINLSSFIENLTNRLIKNSEYRDFSIEFDLDREINLKIEILTPLSLILNEIISNAIKHGYKDFKGDKKLYISAKIVDYEKGELIVMNNGSRLPDDFDIENPRTLGLIMITQLIEQINGEISLTDSEDTGFKIIFPLD